MRLLVPHPWKRGPLADASGPVLVSVTEFEYRRLRTMPLVALHALRLRRRWGTRQGAVALRTAGHPSRPISVSLSVWRSEDDLRAFLAAPEHARLVRGFRPRLSKSRSVVFELESFDAGVAWREGMRRLAALPS